MFKFVQDGHVVTVEMRVDEGVTWWELSDHFFNFLQASGYVITRQDFAEYWADQLDEYPDEDYPQDEEEPTVSIKLDTDPNDTFVFDGMNTLSARDDSIVITTTPVDASTGHRVFASMADTLGAR